MPGVRLSLEYSSAWVPCCPHCGSETALIYAKSLPKPMTCRSCLSVRNPDGFKALLKREAEASNRAELGISEMLRDFREKCDLMRGWAYWVPKKPQIEEGPKPEFMTMDQWGHYRLVYRSRK